MKSQAVVITRTDGGLSVMRLIGVEATDEIVAAEIAKAGIEATGWRPIEENELPLDRSFRDAWTDIGKVEVDMPKARNIHRQRLRELRGPLLAALDIDYQRADEVGDAKLKARIAARKQMLRDITIDPAIEAAATPTELSVAALAQLSDSASK